MQVKNGKIMFCYCCSNGNLVGGCIYGREDECGITTERLNEIFNDELVKELQECGELPYNFHKFEIGQKTNEIIKESKK